MRDVLDHNILNYWIDHVTDHEDGGYYGEIDGHDHLVPGAEKGAILNARILWAFSAAYRVTGNKEYLKAADRAKAYILDYFIDRQYGGVYWSVDAKGNPLDTKKQTYAIGFTIYGMSEYARATGDKEALKCAIALYHDIEDHAYDARNNGYIEALTREWQPISDMRLSDKDENGSRTMNTHLHIIEPYTNLYRIWKDASLEKQIRNLLQIFTTTIFHPSSYHLDLFFDDQWKGKRNIQSFGHDIEASWLLHESALTLGDSSLLTQIQPIVKEIAKAAEEWKKEHMGERKESGNTPDEIFDRARNFNPSWMPDQYYAALTNLQSVGVMGDERTYDYAVALRAVKTIDFMTAEACDIPFAVLQTVMSRIINEVRGVNRVFYDLTSKPPGTIELE